MQDIASSKLSDITVFNKYAKFLSEVSRRENYNEIADRNKEMHQLKYPQLAARIENIYRDFVHTKKTLPSMRSMQFGGRPILLAENRIYNCAYAPVELTKFFSELMFLLLGGTGMGYSVQRRHVNQLHKVKTPESDLEYKFQIQDSIIGWADSIKVVLKAFLKGGTLPVFDYRDIREKGTDLVTTGGKAPGPEPLRKCINTIIPILRQAIGRKLTPLECHDISCIIADSVRAGGIRRAAMIALFDRDDEEMLNCKSLVDVQDWWSDESDSSADNVKVFWVDRYGIEGQAQLENFQWRALLATDKLPWYLVHPYRARANNSAVLPRGKVSEEEFRALLKVVEASGCGEPGIYWTNNEDWGTNPSLRKGTKVLTTEGILPIEALQDKEFFVKNLNGNISKARCWLSGRGKRLYELKLSTGMSYFATAEHEWPVITEGGITKVRTPDLRPSDKLPVIKEHSLFNGVVGSRMDGFFIGWLLGDGWVCSRSDNGVTQIGMVIGDTKLEIKDKLEAYLSAMGIQAKFNYRSNGTHELNTCNNTLNKLLDSFEFDPSKLSIPKAIFSKATEEARKGFIDGLFSSDGHVEKGKRRLILTSSRRSLLEDVAELLGFYGIRSTICDGITILNGKEFNKYNLKISDATSLRHFRECFTLSNTAKQARLDAYDLSIKTTPKTSVKVVEVIETDLFEDVWDISVFDETHCFQLSHCITGNCCEIGLRPYQMCNLTTINVSSIKNQEDFNLAAGAAAFLGTLQAGYTDFHYLNPKWKIACEKEALLGVSMTGIASGNIDNLDAEEAAQYAKDINEQVADELGINSAARVTAVKPEGTSSLVLGTSSGIHAWHGEYYIRRMRAGKDEALAQYLMRVVPELVEEDVTDPNQVVLSFPQKAPEGAVLRHESMMELLDRVRNISESWVRAGHRSGDNYHNVSCTISVKDDEWASLTDWMWDHRDVYNGISVMPFFGSTAYPQMPFEDISKEQYEALLPLLERIDISHVKETDGSAIDLAAEAACAGGVCEIL